jgi:DNA mismatch repair protein MutS2
MRQLGVGSHQAENMLDAIYGLRDKMEAEEAGTRLALREAEEQRDLLAVLVKTLDKKGEVVAVSKNEVMVAIGRLQMRARFEDLEFKSRPVEEETEYVSVGGSVASSGIELDLRGKRVEEGLIEMDRFLDNAFLARMPWVRIIHGKGTGKMREAVRDALKHNYHVTSWEEGKDGEGGAGVTVAKFEER